MSIAYIREAVDYVHKNNSKIVPLVTLTNNCLGVVVRASHKSYNHNKIISWEILEQSTGNPLILAIQISIAEVDKMVSTEELRRKPSYTYYRLEVDPSTGMPKIEPT